MALSPFKDFAMGCDISNSHIDFYLWLVQGEVVINLMRVAMVSLKGRLGRSVLLDRDDGCQVLGLGSQLPPEQMPPSLVGVNHQGQVGRALVV
ncbi:outer membrane usher protein [Sesbania bispinosa]|nr:outer membrane usher protein [Sesbania bispinosa]